MNKFYLNNYSWIEPFASMIFAAIFFYFASNADEVYSQRIINKLLSLNDSALAVLASLMGFVFASFTVIVGLGDSYRKNVRDDKLTSIIERLSTEISLRIEEAKLIREKVTASSLFFESSAYPLTMKLLVGCIFIFVIGMVFSVVITVVGSANIVTGTIIVFYLSYSLFSVIRISILIRYLVSILSNREHSRK